MSRRSCNPPVRGWLLMIVLSTLTAMAAAGEDDSASPLRFRRVYVPADRPADWPKGDAVYKPIDAGQFERLVRNVAGPSGDGIGTAQIQRATYAARMQGEKLLVGEATFDVQALSDELVMVPLEPCGIALSACEWETGGQRRPAQIGLSRDNRLVLLIRGSGKLNCKWTARGRRDAAGQLQFHLQLPPSVSKRFDLQLPEAFRPTLEHGLVNPLADAEPGQSKWHIDVGGRNQLNLRIARLGSADSEPRLNLLKQLMTYDFSMRGLQLDAEMTLSVYRDPLKQLTLLLDSELQLVDARLGDRPITWTIKSRHKDGRRQVVLDFEQPIAGADRVLRLRALAPLKTDAAWTLPRIEPLELFWQEGAATLLIAEPLSLAQLHLSDCRQSEVGALPGTATGESIELQYHGARAAVEVLLAERPSSAAVKSATVFDLDDRYISGKMVCDVSVTGPERFHLQGEVPENWAIESVASEPSGLIAKTSESGRTLDIQLKRGISADNPLRLIIIGRNRRSPLGRKVDATELQMFRFSEIQSSRHVIRVNAREPFHLRAVGPDALRQLDPFALPVDDFDRLSDQPDEELNGLLWLHDRGHNRFAVTLEKQSPRFVAETRVTAVIGYDSLRETSQIECTPQDSAVDRLVVRFARKRDEDPLWTVVDASGEPVDGVRATRTPGDSKTAETEGETWTVTWNRPLSEAFQVTADRASPSQRPVAISLVGVPFAAEQLGTVTVRGVEGVDVAVAKVGLKPLPAAQVASGKYNPVQARFRYDPDRHVVDSGSASLTVAAMPRIGPSAGAVVWRAQCESWFTHDGRASHRIIYHLENDGRRRVTATMNRETVLRSASIDGEPVRLPGAEIMGQASIALPEGRRFLVIELWLETAKGSRGFRWYRHLNLPAPQLDIPILSWSRILHAPPGSAVVNSQDSRAPGPAGLSWQRRLFGPFARDEQDGVFDPFDFSSWRTTTGMPSPELRSETAMVTQFLDGFGRVLKKNRRAAVWRQLEEWDEFVADAEQPLAAHVFIDRPAMVQAGITPDSLISVTGDGPAQDLAAAAFVKANLVTVVAGNCLLITGADGIANDRPCLAEGVAYGSRNEFTAGSAPEEVFAASGITSAVPLRTWAADRQPFRSPWATSRPDGYALTESKGWTTTYIDTDGAQSVYLFNTAVLSASTWTMFLLVAVGAWLWLPSRFARRAVLLAVLAILALVLDASVAPLATSALLAVIVAMLWRAIPWMRLTAWTRSGLAVRSGGQDRLADVTLDTTKTQRVSLPEALLLLLMTFTVLSVVSRKADAEAQPVHSAPIHRVFVPVDADKLPVGDTYYIPAPLFDALHRRFAERRDTVSGWLLTAATYQGQLEWEPDRSRLSVANLTALYTIEVFARHARVTIPLGTATVGDQPIRVSIDGKPILPVSTNPNGSIEVTISDPGIYQVEVALQPATEVLGATRRLDIEIPKLATSRLELDIPVDAPEIEVDSAIGSVTREVVRGHLSAQLGATNQLAMSWRDGGIAGAATMDDVDQLLWLKIQPGAVVVDARMRLNVKDRRVRQLRLAVDPQLRLLPPLRAVVDGQSVGLSHVRTIPGDPQTIELEFEKSVTGVQDLRLQFLLTDITGVGNVRLPYLELKGAQTSRYWVAVSVDPSLRIDRNSVPQNEALTAIATTTLSDPWNIGESKPALYYRQSRLGIDWSFPAYPQESETIGLRRVSLSCADGHVNARLEVDLETTAGYRFQYFINVPHGFVADSVSLLADGVDRVARWAITPDDRATGDQATGDQASGDQASGDRLTVFLNGPAAGRQQLAVVGRFPSAIGVLELPTFRLDDVALRGSQVALYRKPAVRVELDDMTGLQPAGDILPAVVPTEFGRSIGVFTTEADDRATKIRIERNEAIASGVQITSIDRDAGQWNAEIDLRIDVQAGLLDEIRLRIPAEFKGPFVLQPEVAHHIDNLADSKQSVLVVRPHQAITDEYRLHVRGPLRISSGDLISPPVVDAGDIAEMVRYLALPKQVESQDVEWSTSGLVRRPLPADSGRRPTLEQSSESFLVSGRTYRAVLKSVGRTQRSPYVHLADIKIQGGNGDRFIGQAAFDLEPAGLSAVQIRLPKKSRLVHARVGGLAATPAEIDDHSWQLALGSENLPQRIEVVYEAPFDSGSGGEVLAVAPLMYDTDGPIAVEQTLWSVTGPEPDWKLDGEDSTRSGVASEQLYERTRRILNLVSNVASAEPVDVLAPWYRRWISRLQTARRELANSTLALDGRPMPAWRSRLKKLDDRLEFVGSQLIEQGVFSSIAELEESVDRTYSAWNWSFTTTGSVRRGIFAGQQSSFGVRYRASRMGHNWIRFLLALVLGVAVSVIGIKRWHAWFGERWSALTHLIPPMGLVFVGTLFYWLFLAPSFVGFIAVLLVTCVALLTRWDRTNAST